MGRPAHIKPARTGATRRDFFKRSSAGSLALAATVPLLPGAASAVDLRFEHGVASGDPLQDRVILWTRVTPARPKATLPVTWVVARDPSLRDVVRRGTFTTGAVRDHTVKIDVDGLQPGRTYYYRFKAEGRESPVGRTRTLPAGSLERLRMAVVSCSNHASGYFNAYARIAQRADLDLMVHLGDYLYEYGAGQYGTLRTPEPPTEIVTLADYRMRHAQYKRDADSQAALRQHPLVAIWDDHETANDAWRDGAQNHQDGLEGAWPARVAAALQAYYEWMPVRESVPVDHGVRPGSAPAALAALKRQQRSFQFGNLAELVMLEQRLQGRDRQLPATLSTPLGPAFVQAGAFNDPARSLLGAEQEAWLADRLRRTPARWKLIGQGVMFAQLKGVAAANAAGGGAFLNPDQWDGYQPARNRVYAVLQGGNGQLPVNNVVVLTGDIHSSWAADLTPDPNNPDVTSGGYNPATGEGARAVEFVGTSVSSPGVDSDTNGAVAGFLRSVNPHFKYINLHRRGYMLLDVTAERVVCEWWYVDTVASPSNIETFAVAFEVRHGMNRLAPAAQTTARADAPALAP
jgi:alkaline phosphatase D